MKRKSLAAVLLIVMLGTAACSNDKVALEKAAETSGAVQPIAAAPAGAAAPQVNYKSIDTISFGVPAELSDEVADEFKAEFISAMENFALKVQNCELVVAANDADLQSKVEAGEVTCAFMKMDDISSAPDGVTVLLQFKDQGYVLCSNNAVIKEIYDKSGMEEVDMQIEFGIAGMITNGKAAKAFETWGLNTVPEYIK